jgi:hypothetical protein
VPILRLARGHDERAREGDVMIRTDDELAVVRRQLARVEDALAALRRDVLSKNRRNFEIMSEGYVEQITALRDEIDAYLGVALRVPAGQAAGVIRSLDLDAQTFVLRQRPGQEPDLPCEFDAPLEEVVKSALDRPVRVVGVLEKSRKTRKEKMEVEMVELLPAPGELTSPSDGVGTDRESIAKPA